MKPLEATGAIDKKAAAEADHYTPFVDACATQPELLEQSVVTIAEQIRSGSGSGDFGGPGPIFVGIGASLAAACAPVWHLRRRGIHAWRLGSGDLPLPFPVSRHPLVGVSQSGRSTETLAVLESVEPSLRLGVVNVHPSPVTALVRRAVLLGNLPDSYASTIGYTATVMALGMMAEAWDHGEVDEEWESLPEAVERIQAEIPERLAALDAMLAEARSADFVGAGPSVGSAEAGALLFREVARVPAAAMSTRQYLHGPMESAGDGVHILLGDHRELEVAETLSEAGHHVILVSSADVEETPRLHAIQIPALPVPRRAVIEAVVLQALAGEVARLRGVDVEEFVFHNADTKVAAD